MVMEAHPTHPMADKADKQAGESGSPENRRKPDDEVVGKVYDARLMRRLGRYVRPYWVQAGVSSLAVSLKSLCDVAGPILVMVAVDRYLSPDTSAQDPSNAVAHWVANNSPLARLLPTAPVQGVTPARRSFTWSCWFRLTRSSSSRCT